MTYTRRVFDAPAEVDRLALDGPRDPGRPGDLPGAGRPGRPGARPAAPGWSASTCRSRRASPAEAVRLFWSYVRSWGHGELPDVRLARRRRAGHAGVRARRRGQPGSGGGRRLTGRPVPAPAQRPSAAARSSPARSLLVHEGGGGGPVVGRSRRRSPGPAPRRRARRTACRRRRPTARRLIAPYATVGPAASRAASSCAAGSTSSSSSTSWVSRPSRSRLVGRHRLGQHQQLDRLGVADEPGQRPRDAGVGGQADVGEGHQERWSPARRSGSRRARPATRPRRRPCRGPPPPPAWACWPAGPRSGCSARRTVSAGRSAPAAQGLDVLAQVLPDAEGPPGAGEHHRPAGAVGLQRRPGCRAAPP